MRGANEPALKESLAEIYRNLYTPGWASIANTSGFLVPTLELVALPSAGPPAQLTWDGTVNGNWDTNTANWKTNSTSPSTRSST